MKVKLLTTKPDGTSSYKTLEPWPFPEIPRIGDHVCIDDIDAGQVWRVDWICHEGRAVAIIHAKVNNQAVVPQPKPAIRLLEPT